MDIGQLYKIFCECKAVSTDSRVGKGIFFGLKGERFDGALYGDQALENGAVCAVTQNALETLQELASFHRDHLKCPILAITGTNGKTTTKELIVTVLQTKFNLGFTKGNLNNHIGVPLTLLSFDQKTEIAIVEMGANHIGEIETLCKIAKPDLGIITNVGYAHLEGFGSFEGVVKTKGELYDFINSRSGRVFFNSDDQNLVQMLSQRNDLKKIPYTVDFECFIEESGVVSVIYQSKTFRTNLVGLYNRFNIAAALEIGHYFGIDKRDALDAICSYIPSNNRSQVIQTKRNKIFLDAYNANPSSMKEALDNFSKINHPNKIAILGDMKELGEVSYREHLKIKQFAISNNIDRVILIGDNFKLVDSSSFLTINDLQTQLENISDAAILIKGSRSMSLEKLVDFL